MTILFRGLAYAAVFVGVLLVLLPARLVGRTGLAAAASVPLPQRWAGGALALGGGALALWCVLTLARRGGGTPAPFDPPRRLVTDGPYRHLRNPMYAGGVLALAGASLYFGSVALAAYAAGFLAAALVMVRGYEEPHLRATFAAEYETYCREVPRWWPSWRTPRS